MTKQEIKKIILSRIDEIASKGELKLQDIRDKDANGEYSVSQDGFTCDYTKDVLYDVAEDNIRNLYFLHGLIGGLIDSLN